MGRSLLRLEPARTRFGRSRSAWYDDIAQGLMVPPVHLGPRCSVWPDDELDALMAARIAGRTDAEIRNLVADLVAARKQADKAAA